MPFCKFCGKEIPEGAVCDCMNFVEKKTYDEVRFGAREIKAAASENKHQLIIGAVCILIMIAAFIGIIVFIFSGGSEEPVVRTTGRDYEKPVEEFVNAYNKNNSERMMKVMLPSDYISELKENTGSPDDWNDYINELNEAIIDEKDSLEKDYGKNVTMSIEFLDRKEVKKSEFSQLEKLYIDRFESSGIKSAYKVKIELEFAGFEDHEIDKYWIYVVEIRGDGWLISPFDNDLDLGHYIGVKSDDEKIKSEPYGISKDSDISDEPEEQTTEKTIVTHKTA